MVTLYMKYAALASRSARVTEESTQHPDGGPLHGLQRHLLAVAPALRDGAAHGQGGEAVD